MSKHLNVKSESLIFSAHRLRFACCGEGNTTLSSFVFPSPLSLTNHLRDSDDGGRSGDFETELLLLAGGRMGEDKEGYGMGDAAFP